MPELDVEMEAAPSTSSNTTWHQNSNNYSHNSNHVSDTRKTSSSGKREDADDDMEELNDSDDMFDDPPEILNDFDDFDPIMPAAGSSSSEVTSSRRPPPLLPDDYGDEAMAAIKFSEEFRSRYGRPHPAFFPAALDDAIKESCMQPAKDVSKLLFGIISLLKSLQ